MPNPEKHEQEPEPQENTPEPEVEEDPYEILKRGREELKNLDVKDLRENLQLLESRKEKLRENCRHYERMKLNGVSEEELEEIRQERQEIEKELEEVEEEIERKRAELKEKFQKREDEIKKNFTDALKKKIKEEE